MHRTSSLTAKPTNFQIVISNNHRVPRVKAFSTNEFMPHSRWNKNWFRNSYLSPINKPNCTGKAIFLVDSVINFWYNSNQEIHRFVIFTYLEAISFCSAASGNVMYFDEKLAIVIATEFTIRHTEASDICTKLWDATFLRKPLDLK